MGLQDVFVGIQEEMSPTGDQVAILISPPLTEDRARCDLREPNWIQKLWKLPKEFAKLQFKRLSSWERYEKEIALPVAKHLKELYELTEHPYIIPDATFCDFRKVLSNDKFQLVFLIAHHMMKVSQAKTVEDRQNLDGAIEFADGGRNMESILACIKSACRRRPVNLVYVVCYSDDLRSNCYMLSPKVKAIGGFPSLAHFVTGVEFAKEWIMKCDGIRRISEAHDAAMRVMLSKLSIHELGKAQLAARAH